MSRKGKSNKAILEGINYSMDVVKKAKSNEEFSVEEKEEILSKFVGMSKDNNSYFTPHEICNFIKELLNIKSGRVADLSAGIGSMAKPFIKEYRHLIEGIQFDCYEFDENNSLAGKVAWSDYDNVRFVGDFNSIEQHDEIESNYDFIIGNPPFSGSVKYWNEWNHNKNGTAKNANIADAFVDLCIRKTKDKGYIALVLPAGHMHRGQGTAKLREWMRDQVAIKAVIPLDSDTFKDSGVKGTSVGTVLVVMQKGAVQKEIFYGKLQDKDDLLAEMSSLAYQFRMFTENDYDITYQSDSSSGLCAYMSKPLKPWKGAV